MKAKYSIGKGKNKIVLATVCPTCNGEGYFIIDDNPKGRICDDCDGMGSWATKDGVKLLTFISDIMIKGRRK